MFFLATEIYQSKTFEGTVLIWGRVTDNYENEQYYYRLVLDNVHADEEEVKNISVFVSKNENKEINVGDIIIFEAELENINLFTLQSFNSNYVRENIGYSTKVNSSDLVIAKGWTKTDENIRMSIKDLLYENLSEDNASICYAVLFGDKSNISENTENIYRSSGIIHILTVSGLHVGFLIFLIFGFLKLCKVNKFFNFVFTTIFIVIYAWLCGFIPSVLRAGFMAIIFMIAKISGKRYDTLNSLGVAGIIICLINPLTALDIGFLMSVFCVIGITFLYPIFVKYLSKIIPAWASEYISLSLSAQIAILPFLASFGSTYNFLSFLANLLVVPFFGILYPFLFVISFITLLVPFVQYLLIFCEWGFNLINTTAQVFSSTHLQIHLQSFHILTIFVLYLSIFVISRFFMVKAENKFLIYSFVILFLISFLGLNQFFIKEKANIVYLNSYQEECFIFTNNKNEKLLVGNNYILGRYANNFKVYDFDFCFLEQISQNDINELEGVNVDNYFCVQGDCSIQGLNIIVPNNPIQIGGFTMNVFQNNGKNLAFGIEFDNIKIIIVTQSKNEYNSYYEELFNQLNPDIVFSGKNNSVGNNNFTFSVSKNDFSNFSFQEVGNCCFYFNNNELSIRGLD